MMKKETFKTFIVFCLLFIIAACAVKFIFQSYKIERFLLNGKILCAQLMSASIKYYKETGIYLENDKVSFRDEYIDARRNPYFSIFSTYPIDEKTQGISVFGTVEGNDYELRIAFNKDSEPQPLKNLKFQTIKRKKEKR